MVSGQRQSIQSAQLIKQDADQIVDSIVADDIGKLPDRSVTESLQRVPGVTIERFMDIGDPEHFSAEGSGVADRKSTRLNSSHVAISYAVFCLKKKSIEQING